MKEDVDAANTQEAEAGIFWKVWNSEKYSSRKCFISWLDFNISTSNNVNIASPAWEKIEIQTNSRQIVNSD